jgi:CotH kinase protein
VLENRIVEVDPNNSDGPSSKRRTTVPLFQHRNTMTTVPDDSSFSDRKEDFFARDMYMVHVRNFPHERLVLQAPVKSSGNARLEVWTTDPKDNRHIPPPSDEGVLFGTSAFSVMNSGNRTLYAPKPSWKFNIKAADEDSDLVGMGRLNLKAMYNDPSNMREALAWSLFKRVGVPASRHTFAKLAFDAVYRGLFSLIEEVDKRFLKDHFGKNRQGNLYKAYCGDKGCATLEHLSKDGDDSGQQYFTPGKNDLTYRLKTNQEDAKANTYDDLAFFIRTINGVELPGGDEKFGTDGFRESVDRILNTRAFLRWAAANVLLGSWDNYFATPANYYLYNSGLKGTENDFMDSPYFTFIPWDYDNCLGIDYFDTRWQDTDLLDWPSNTTRYSNRRKRSSIPLVQNLLSNHDYRQYYLDSVEHLLDTEFNPDAVAALISPDLENGLWARLRQAAYLESDTPHGAPFTGRQFTNDEVYCAGCKQKEIRHDKARIEGILNYVRMRYDSARAQLKELRKTNPRGAGTDEFPATMEPLPGRA